jgi:hypothetical protein
MMRHYPGCDDQPTATAATDAPPGPEVESERTNEQIETCPSLLRKEE